MPMPSPLVIALLAVLFVLLVYKFVRDRREKNKTYAQLLAEYQVLEKTVNEWRHPNGVPVEWDERGKLNRRFVEAWRRVRSHPDHPPENDKES